MINPNDPTLQGPSVAFFLPFRRLSGGWGPFQIVPCRYYFLREVLFFCERSFFLREVLFCARDAIFFARCYVFLRQGEGEATHGREFERRGAASWPAAEVSRGPESPIRIRNRAQVVGIQRGSGEAGKRQGRASPSKLVLEGHSAIVVGREEKKT